MLMLPSYQRLLQLQRARVNVGKGNGGGRYGPMRFVAAEAGRFPPGPCVDLADMARETGDYEGAAWCALLLEHLQCASNGNPRSFPSLVSSRASQKMLWGTVVCNTVREGLSSVHTWASLYRKEDRSRGTGFRRVIGKPTCVVK